MKVPAAAVRVEDHSTVEDRLPRNSLAEVSNIAISGQKHPPSAAITRCNSRIV